MSVVNHINAGPEALYVVDEIGQIVSATDAVTFPSLKKHINYMYGHPLDIIKQLQELTSSPDTKDRASKYPMIALYQDFPEKKGVGSGLWGTVSLHIIIANITEPGLKSAERYETNFKPVLYPIYQELLHQVFKSRRILKKSEDDIAHTKIDRVFWGTQGLFGNTANMFNDFLDAIEIQNLEITFRKINF